MDRGLKTQHEFKDFLYWNLMVAVPLFTACVGIFMESLLWLILYLLISLGCLVLIYRFYCTHCPHYINAVNSSTRCMFFWGMPRFFDARQGPLGLFDKTIAFAAPAIVLVLPLYWLVFRPALLIIYVLSVAAMLTSVIKNECGRCVYFNCPVNRVPEDVKNGSSSF